MSGLRRYSYKFSKTIQSYPYHIYIGELNETCETTMSINVKNMQILLCMLTVMGTLTSYKRDQTRPLDNEVVDLPVVGMRNKAMKLFGSSPGKV